MREAFEKWYEEDCGFDVSRCWNRSVYQDPDVENDWQVWQAASYKAQPVQTVQLRWDEAPRSISFGAGMMITDIGLDKDSTATVTCHRDDLHKFERLLSAAQEQQ